MRVLALLVAISAPAHADPFEPPASVPAAQDHYTRGKALFSAKQYADAAAEFQAALDLDPTAKFLLFDLALARRMAGSCREAITAYESFLAENPPERYQANAKIGLDKCRDAIAHAPPPTEPIAPTKPITPPPPPVVAPPPRSEPPPQLAVEPWYHDRFGNTLLIAGAASLTLSAIILWRERSDASDTFSAPDLHTYKDSHDAAVGLQGLSVITAGVGVVLCAASLVRYATRPDKTIVVAPTPGGAAASFEVRF